MEVPSFVVLLTLCLVFLIVFNIIFQYAIHGKNYKLESYKTFLEQSIQFNQHHAYSEMEDRSHTKEVVNKLYRHGFSKLGDVPLGSPNSALRNRGFSGKFKKIPGMILANCSHKGYEALVSRVEAEDLCLEMENCFGFDFYTQAKKAYFCVDEKLVTFVERQESKASHFYMVSRK